MAKAKKEKKLVWYSYNDAVHQVEEGSAAELHLKRNKAKKTNAPKKAPVQPPLDPPPAE